MKRVWSIQKIELLKKLKNKGLSHKEIAQKVGAVSPNAVGMKVGKLVKKGELIVKKPIHDNNYTFKNISKEDLLKGIIMWWCEGTKPSQANVSVEFVNSDPTLIWHFLNFLRKLNINEKKLRLKLKINHQEERKAKLFWTKLTNLPLSAFNKSSRLSGKGKRKRKLKYGTLTVKYSSKKLLMDMTNKWKELMEKDLPSNLEKDKYKINCR